jgi:hypothetical protein
LCVRVCVRACVCGCVCHMTTQKLDVLPSQTLVFFFSVFFFWKILTNSLYIYIYISIYIYIYK